MPEPATVSPSLLRISLLGLCPKCGAQTLFRGWVSFAHKCSGCGLDIQGFNVGDGAAAFLIFFITGIVFAGVIIVQLSYSPPWWVHVLLWVPLTFALTLGLLRISKAALLTAEYRNAAREGKRIS